MEENYKDVFYAMVNILNRPGGYQPACRILKNYYIMATITLYTGAPELNIWNKNEFNAEIDFFMKECKIKSFDEFLELDDIDDYLRTLYETTI